LVLFHAALSHEIFHYLCLEGYISLIDIEVIPQAISTLETFKAGGKEALERLWGELDFQLFSAGEELAKEEKTINNASVLLQITLNVLVDYGQKNGWPVEGSEISISPEQLQRCVGVLLAGWSYRIEQESGKESLMSLLDFGKEVLAKRKGQTPLTLEDVRYIQGICQEIEDLTHVLSRDYSLRMVPWQPIWPEDQFIGPTWRIIAMQPRDWQWRRCYGFYTGLNPKLLMRS
jgi:hypothetical protein